MHCPPKAIAFGGFLTVYYKLQIICLLYMYFSFRVEMKTAIGFAKATQMQAFARTKERRLRERGFRSGKSEHAAFSFTSTSSLP